MKRRHDFIRIGHIIAHKGQPHRVRGMVVGYVRFNSRNRTVKCRRRGANGVKVQLGDEGANAFMGFEVFGHAVACWRQDVCCPVPED